MFYCFLDILLYSKLIKGSLFFSGYCAIKNPALPGFLLMYRSAD